jgi:hypothetical protein
MMIECASAFASSATVESRYHETLKVLYPVVVVPLLESFLVNLNNGSGFQIANITFDRNGMHRSNSYGAVQKGLLGAWVSMAGGRSVTEREQRYQHMTWGNFGGHSFSAGNIRLYSSDKALWTQFSLRDTWNAVCLGPLLEFLYEKRMSDRNALRPQEGSSIDDALYAFVNACKRTDPDTLFITDYWIEPRLRSLRAHLSDPVTREQAKALCEAIDKRVALDTVIDWLTHSRDSWQVFEEKRIEADAAIGARIMEQEESERRKRIEERKQRQIATRGTFEGRMIAGVPIARIPDSVRKYPDFLTWWNEVGRLRPKDSQGWSILSGQGVMWSRSEMIAPDLWDALPAEEKETIEAWAHSLPDGGMLD